MTKLMENQQKEQIRKAVNEFCNQKSLSKRELAEKIGVSASTLSNIDNEKWELIKEEMWLKIWNVVKPQEWRLVQTSNFQLIFKICEDARLNGKMLGIVGYTGAGKTTALTEYYRNKPGAYYIRAKKSMKPRQFFQKLLQEMGISYSGSIYDMIERISDEFNRTPKPLLIIDEAGKLSQSMLLYLHDLRDNTTAHAGIVLAGVEYFKTNLVKYVQKQKEGMPEFFRRVNAWQELSLPSRNEIAAICKANGISEDQAVRSLYRVKDYGTLYNQIVNLKLAEE